MQFLALPLDGGGQNSKPENQLSRQIYKSKYVGAKPGGKHHVAVAAEAMHIW